MSERLLLTPEPAEGLRLNKPARFFATLESTGEHVVTSHQPLLDAARHQLARGFDPATPLTMRHASTAHDSFAPQPMGQLTKLTCGEGEKMPLQRQRWKPRGSAAAPMREGQKSGSADWQKGKGSKTPAPPIGAAAIAPAAAILDD